MVMDFYKKNDKLSLDDLIKKGVGLGGYTEGVGWVHITLIQIARSYGFSGFRRKWVLGEKDLEWLKPESYSEEEINNHNQQLLEEGIYQIRESIKKGNPVIISAPKSFNPKNSGHLVVITGIKRDGFYLNDPDNPDRKVRKNIFVDLETFKKVWSRRAIFIYQ